jgi:hypothetical protein
VSPDDPAPRGQTMVWLRLVAAVLALVAGIAAVVVVLELVRTVLS